MALRTFAPDTTTVAAEARAFAREHGFQVGERGRVSREMFIVYFLARPQRARQVAKSLGIEVSARGRLSAVDAEKVAEAVTTY